MIFEDESYLGCYKNHFVGTKTDFDGQRSCELNHSDMTGLWKMRVTLFLELHNNLTNLIQLQTVQNRTCNLANNIFLSPS
jgi:hypothetical protein